MTTREAELELENLRLREALTWAKSGFSQAAGGFQSQKHLEEHWRVCSEALSTPSGTNVLSALIEKVERATIERCAKHLDDKEVERTNYCMNVYEEGEQYKSEAIAEIRALTTGQIKLEDL